MLQHQFLRTPATVTRMDHNNFVLSVPSASGPAETATDDDSPHAAQQSTLDKLRESLAMSPDSAFTGIVVHDSYRKLPDPTAQVRTSPHSTTRPSW